MDMATQGIYSTVNIWKSIGAIASFDSEESGDYNKAQIKAFNGVLSSSFSGVGGWTLGTKLKDTVVVIKSTTANAMRYFDGLSKPLLLGNFVSAEAVRTLSARVTQFTAMWNGVRRIYRVYDAKYGSDKRGMHTLSALNDQVDSKIAWLERIDRVVSERFQRATPDKQLAGRWSQEPPIRDIKQMQSPVSAEGEGQARWLHVELAKSFDLSGE